MSVSPIHARLRAETADLHAQVEATIDLPARLASPASYAAMLSRFLGFIEPAERMLEGVAWPRDAAFEARRKTALLLRDLGALGFDQAAIEAIPRAPSPPPRALPGAYGWLYVLEGSTLGSRLILREAARALGPEVSGATAYFAGYGARTGAMWTAFLASLVSASSPACHDAVLDGAKECFAALDAWFAEQPG